MSNIRLPRRDFLKLSAAAGGAMLSPALAMSADSQGVPVIDTHLHCFAGANDSRFPYHSRAPYRPERVAPPEHLLKLMVGAGVDYAIVVHPEPYQDDHRYLEHCLLVGKRELKGTCLFFADRPNSVQRMHDLVKRNEGRIVAARIHAYAPERLPPFGKPELRTFWKGIADLGLAVQLHFEPRYAPGFDALIREFSKTPVIIDHLGRPLQGSPEEYEHVLGWSELPNTIVKISSLPDQNRYPHRDIAPFVRELGKRFGPERLIYGGGYSETATAASYREYRERVRGYFADFSTADQAKILGGNAARLFGFPVS